MGSKDQLAHAFFFKHFQQLAENIFKDARVKFIDGQGEGRIVVGGGQKAQKGDHAADAVGFIPQGHSRFPVADGHDIYHFTCGTVFHNGLGDGMQFNGKARDQFLDHKVHFRYIVGNVFIRIVGHDCGPIRLDGERTPGGVQQQR